MRILFMRCEDQFIRSIIMALDEMGHEVALWPRQVENMYGNEKEQKVFRDFLQNNQVDFVLSTVFFRLVALITHETGVKYVVYSVDSPQFGLYFPVFSYYDNCYFFHFDKKECELNRGRGIAHLYHLPLAANVAQAKRMRASGDELRKYGCDISFVGGVYENNYYDEIKASLPADLQDQIAAILEASAFRWDETDRIMPMLSDSLVRRVKECCPECFERQFEMEDRYYFRSYVLSRKLSHIERTLLLEMLAEQYDFRLYTYERTKISDKVNRFPPVNMVTDSYKVFQASKINLNLTLRSIESAVPLRVFDIMSAGGFVLTNWQEEAVELFEEDKEIVTFKTPEEMLEKIDYYLAHDDERKKIGRKGLEKVQSCYTYHHQLGKITEKISEKN